MAQSVSTDDLDDFATDVIDYLVANGEDRVAGWLAQAARDRADHGPAAIAREEGLATGDGADIPAAAETIADRVHTHLDASADHSTEAGE